MADALVSTDWLARSLADPLLVVLDCSWYLPEAKRSGRAEFATGHIPGARFIDLNEISDASSPYVNMMPPADQFASIVAALGVSNDSEVVIYDSSYVSPRVWWMFRGFGHDKVRILDGGWRKWKAEGRPAETGDAAPARPATFVAGARPNAVAGWKEVLQASRDGSKAVIDARTAERFTGAMPSGYPGVPGGHIPGSTNIPWSKFYRPDFTFVSPDAARTQFVESGVDPSRPAIATCGSGVTAAILVLMLERMGYGGASLYDGSWHEWGQRPDLPKESVAKA